MRKWRKALSCERNGSRKYSIFFASSRRWHEGNLGTLDNYNYCVPFPTLHLHLYLRFAPLRPVPMDTPTSLLAESLRLPDPRVLTCLDVPNLGWIPEKHSSLSVEDQSNHDHWTGQNEHCIQFGCYCLHVHCSVFKRTDPHLKRVNMLLDVSNLWLSMLSYHETRGSSYKNTAITNTY